jgi:hypothetical protein
MGQNLESQSNDIKQHEIDRMGDNLHIYGGF